MYRSNHIVRGTATTSKWVETHSDGRYAYRTKVKTGEQDYEGEVEIIIDIDAIVRTLGRKALLSKGGKSVDGWVKVKKVSKKILATRLTPDAGVSTISS